MKNKFYLHTSADMSEIKKNLEDEDMPESAKRKLAEELYNRFYEVGFEVEFCQFTGRIQSVNLKERK